MFPLVYFSFFPVYRRHVHDIISKTYVIGLPPLVSYRGLRLLAFCLSLQTIFSSFLCMTSDYIHFVLRHTNVGFSQIIYGLFLTIVYYEDLCLYWFQDIFFYSIALRYASLPLFCLLQLWFECKCSAHASVTEHLVPSSQHWFRWRRSPGARSERAHAI